MSEKWTKKRKNSKVKRGILNPSKLSRKTRKQKIQYGFRVATVKSRSKHFKSKSSVKNNYNENDCVLPYKIERNEILGRYLVASRNLKAGEDILEECPLVVGPCQESEPICIGCYKVLNLKDENSQRCEKCGYPLCSVTCSGIDRHFGHSTEECCLISKSKYKSKVVEDQRKEWFELRYIVTPIRCLLLKESHPEYWSVVMTMESHDGLRRNISKVWDTNQRLVANKIRDVLGLSEFSEDMIHRVCGVLEVNAFEVNATGKSSLRALYPNAFLFSHDCVPNTTHSDKDDYNLIVRASVPISEGSPLTVTYTYTLQATLYRRKHLKDTKFFDCECKRCSDPTELGTLVGALKCPSCTDGVVLSTSPLDPLAEWRCGNGDNCISRPISGNSVSILIERLSTELDQIDGNDIEGYETFLMKYKNFLHKNHYLFLSALHSLSQLYGKISGYLINDLTDDVLERKIEICKTLLKIFEIIEPGLSKQRGVLLYELHAPLMVSINKRIQTNSIVKKELKVRLKEVSKCLEESISILALERDNSNEGMMVEAARDAIERIRHQQELFHLK